MIFQGLQRYGFASEAKTLSDRLLEMALEKNQVLREYYDAETGLGLGQTRFWGFTALYYGMRLEWQAKYDASSPRAAIRADRNEGVRRSVRRIVGAPGHEGPSCFVLISRYQSV